MSISTLFWRRRISSAQAVAQPVVSKGFPRALDGTLWRLSEVYRYSLGIRLRL